MAHNYRNLMAWNTWLSDHYFGQEVLNAERAVLSTLLKNHFGKQAILIGVSSQFPLLQSTEILYQTLVHPFQKSLDSIRSIETSLTELPLLSASVDLVILPHTLEFVDNPQQLISEACRYVKPEGLIIVCTFNPYSMIGLKRLFKKADDRMPKLHQTITLGQVKNWLQLAEFTTESQQSTLFRPPCRGKALFGKMQFLEKFGAICFRKSGGINIICARAKVIPLTPIKMKWKQTLGNLGLPKITGNIATHSSNTSRETVCETYSHLH